MMSSRRRGKSIQGLMLRWPVALVLGLSPVVAVVAWAAVVHSGSTQQAAALPTFRTEVTNICNSMKVEGELIPPPTSGKDVARYLQQAIVTGQAQHTQLVRLTPPAAVAAPFRAALALQVQAASMGRQFEEKVRSAGPADPEPVQRRLIRWIRAFDVEAIQRNRQIHADFLQVGTPSCSGG